MRKVSASNTVSCRDKPAGDLAVRETTSEIKFACSFSTPRMFLLIWLLDADSAYVKSSASFLRLSGPREAKLTELSIQSLSHAGGRRLTFVEVYIHGCLGGEIAVRGKRATRCQGYHLVLVNQTGHGMALRGIGVSAVFTANGNASDNWTPPWETIILA